jgi:SAM-dependent methyltransferase
VRRAFADHFSPLAAAYAAARPSYPAALFAHLSTVAPGRRRAWDCGTGNGQAALALAGWFDEITATDASAEQLARAPAHAAVTYRVAAAEASGLPSASMDLVTVAQALHWFDPPAFFEEARRVLVPGGIVAVWCYGLQQVGHAELDELLERFYHETVGPYWAPERRLVETGYRTIPFPFDELAAPAFEMAHRWSLAELLAYIRTWSATAKFVSAEGYDPVAPLSDRLRPLWRGDGAGDGRRCVRWPLSLRVGRCTRCPEP